MGWARRLKRVFGIDIDTCTRCGGKFKIIASIEEPEVIARILAHLERTAGGLEHALGEKCARTHHAERRTCHPEDAWHIK
jgi:hypothetical protein